MFSFTDASPGIMFFSIQCVALVVVGTSVFIIRRRRASRQNNNILPIHQQPSFDEKLPITSQIENPSSNSTEWLPPNHYNGAPWLHAITNHAATSITPLHPVLREFESTVDSDPILTMLFTRMFHETPESHDPTNHPQVLSFAHLLRSINVILTMGPPWAYTSAGEKGAIGAPLTAILNYPMATRAGREAFLHPLVNAQIKNILRAWGAYLESPASTSVLSADDNGWLCDAAKETMADVATIHTHHHHNPTGKVMTFEDLFICDPSKPHLGYTSWDAFFTRRFRPHVRPIPSLPAGDDTDPQILSACESAPYRIAENVAARAQFWVKAQPYSLVDMLGAESEYVERFVGGTVYQAYLSALSYHRWHAPVAGMVVGVESIPGTYFAENYRGEASERGRREEREDPVGPIGHVLRQSQGYISEVAARLVMYIQADDERVGMVAVMFVGMVEVSSCVAGVSVGQHVQAGEEVGRFAYGGSSYVLVFEKGRDVVFEEHVRDVSGGRNVPVRSRLARVRA